MVQDQARVPSRYDGKMMTDKSYLLVYEFAPISLHKHFKAISAWAFTTGISVVAQRNHLGFTNQQGAQTSWWWHQGFWGFRTSNLPVDAHSRYDGLSETLDLIVWHLGKRQKGLGQKPGWQLAFFWILGEGSGFLHLHLLTCTFILRLKWWKATFKTLAK